MKIYNTQELIKILSDERELMVDTGRGKLSKPETNWHPAIKAIFGEQGLQTIESYHEFREQIWKYQAIHSVSGIAWWQVDILGKTLRYPHVDSKLLSLHEDIELMKCYKQQVLDYWQQVTSGMDLLLSVGAEDYELTSRDFVNILSAQSEWATISTARFDHQTKYWRVKPENPEVTLQLGWGVPNLGDYIWSEPEDKSEWIIACPSGSK